ncbi:MAG: triose-phosphate isomerase [Nitrospirae bacterium]|nr:MAG: triose-phosphate isomerase [Nitrospirota bacterium]
MRVPLIAANWKMHKTTEETRQFLIEFLPHVSSVSDVEVVIAPPFTSLAVAAKFLKGSSVKLAAQNVFWESSGAYTGEISPVMLKDCECSYVIIGHSERRQYFGETNETVNKKISACQKEGLGVIMCVGETLEQREKGLTFNVLEEQITEGLKDLPSQGLVIAYEPVWAIGTGKTATKEQAQEAHEFIRGLLRKLYGTEAESIRILYGGSVKPENISELMAQPDVDGALVGGASLKVESFVKIVKFKEN